MSLHLMNTANTYVSFARFTGYGYIVAETIRM